MIPRDDQVDRELLRRIAAADRSALERLYLAYQPRLMQFLTRLSSRREILEEAVNDTFWTVWPNSPRPSPPESNRCSRTSATSG